MIKTELLKTKPKRDDMIRNFLPWVSDQGPANRANMTDGIAWKQLTIIKSISWPLIQVWNVPEESSCKFEGWPHIAGPPLASPCASGYFRKSPHQCPSWLCKPWMEESVSSFDLLSTCYMTYFTDVELWRHDPVQALCNRKGQISGFHGYWGEKVFHFLQASLLRFWLLHGFQIPKSPRIFVFMRLMW